MPVISVIIPVYNGEKTIRETIESVLKQTFTDFELIVINDGSPDSTWEIVSRIKDTRVRVFSYFNAGVSVSRNRGISHAVGEYISLLDADDLWTPDKLEAQLKALQENPQAAVAYSWSDRIDENGQFLSKGNYISVTGDVYPYLLLTNFLDNGSNPLIRTQAVREVGGFDESLTNAADWDMWLRLAARYHFVAVTKPQILYRMSPNSMSTNLEKLEAAGKRVRDRAFAQAPQSLQHLNLVSLRNRYKYYTYKALEGYPVRHRGFTAIKFLWYAVRYDPGLLRTRVIWKVLYRIVAVVLLPPQLVQKLLTKYEKLSNIDALLGYIKKSYPLK